MRIRTLPALLALCAALPIGAYRPTRMMQFVHTNPEEALRIGRDVRARRIVAMHFGTFQKGAAGDHRSAEHGVNHQPVIHGIGGAEIKANERREHHDECEARLDQIERVRRRSAVQEPVFAEQFGQ